MSAESTPNRSIQASIGPDGQIGHAQLSSPALDTPVDIYVSDRLVIPVIFLPGIMGSNLYNRKTKEVVWAPDGAVSTGWKYAITWDSSRQERLDMTGTDLYTGGEITATVTADYWNKIFEELGAPPTAIYESEAALRARGWGGVYGSAYHIFMSRLQREMSTIMKKGAVTPLWQEILNLPMQDYGMQGSPLAEDGLKKVAPFRFEVWGGGYNWLKSNAESADQVKEFIETTVLPHYGKNLATKGKVILVTHSMGGLVARSLCAKAPELVLGVLHGAMPANGAGESYTNMRQGVQGVAMGLVAGRDSASVGAVFTQCLGGLELLPFGGGAYNPAPANARVSVPHCLRQAAVSGEWLFMQDPQGQLKSCSSLMDVYEKIYKSEQWYGLLPRHNEHHFDPANILRPLYPNKTPRGIFERFIDNVKNFHGAIRGKYHPQTYAFWSSASDTPATGEALWEWGRYTMMGEDGKPTDDYAYFPRDTGHGAYMHQYNQYTLRTVPHAGDGTVPRASWEADLSNAHIRGYACLGASKNDPRGFEHQQAFIDNRASNISLHFLAKLVSKNSGELKT